MPPSDTLHPLPCRLPLEPDRAGLLRAFPSRAPASSLGEFDSEGAEVPETGLVKERARPPMREGEVTVPTPFPPPHGFVDTLARACLSWDTGGRGEGLL